MKYIRVLFIVALAACSSSTPSDNGPAVTIHLTPLDLSSNQFYFPGPIALRYEVTISNPLAQPITLRGLDLRTFGSGAYSLRTGSTPMNISVPANSTKSFTISTWGRSQGGYLGSTEPVTLRVTAYFDGPSGSFMKLVNENISPL